MTASHSRRNHGGEHEVSSAAFWRPPTADLVRIGSPTRRWFLQTGLSGVAGLSAAELLRLRAQGAEPARASTASTGGSRTPARKAVILFWLSGGPSHIDLWDPKPDAPSEIRGPFGTISTKIPGVRFCEHLQQQAAIADKLTVIRSVDCSASNHTPITMQAGNPLARRTDNGRDGGGYPSMGSIAARFKGANHPSLPAFVGLADSWTSDVWGAGHMGAAYQPVKGSELQGRFALPRGMNVDRFGDRTALLAHFDGMKADLDTHGTMDSLDRYQQMAVEMVTSGEARRAFDLDREDPKLRDLYGRDSLGSKALLARRLVEAGVTFVLVSGAWGYFDHHGDSVVWKGIERGLKPLIPRIDNVLPALIQDLESRGLLDSTLVLMMGEFGRSPMINRDHGRDHWTNVMSMVMAGGGLKHGRVIGATDRKGHGVHERKVTPQDLAATVFQYLNIPLDAHWTNPQGRPIPIITEGGRPISELT